MNSSHYSIVGICFMIAGIYASIAKTVSQDAAICGLMIGFTIFALADILRALEK
mgnify:FL=1